MSTEADAMSPCPAITLSRSFGSGGTEVGLRVARQLGWRFCDRRILRQAAQNLGLPVERLRCQEERPCGFFEQLLRLTAFATPEVPFVPPFERPVYSRELFQVEGSVMRRLADAEPSVLIGRGGFMALKDRPATLHVRIHADRDHRVRFLLEHGKAADENAALRLLHDADQAREGFFTLIGCPDWHATGAFDLVLDAGTLGMETCAQRVVEEARKRFS